MDHKPNCAGRLEVFAVPDVPILTTGDDLGAVILEALAAAHLELRDGDVVVVTSKAFSRCEGRFVDVTTVEPSEQASALGAEIGRDPRVVELVLREAAAISRKAPGVLVVRHRLGFVSANAGIDFSNAEPSPSANGGAWALLLPEAPDASAERLRVRLRDASRAEIGVVVTDSFGRPFRVGTVGAAIGVAGVPALWDRRGDVDLFGRTLEHTITALADQIAAAADLVAGQAAEGRAVVIVRGLTFTPGDTSAKELQRPPEEDLYA